MGEAVNQVTQVYLEHLGRMRSMHRLVVAEEREAPLTEVKVETVDEEPLAYRENLDS